jgi:ubiquitin carboxyl-terminal hydrolase 8
MMEVFEQNDINEFLCVFVDKLNRQVCASINVTKDDLISKYKYTSSDYDIQRFKMDVSWYEKTGKEYSPLVPMFHGQTISQIVCGNCGKIFHNYEIYLNLMLPVTESTNTIYDCLDEFFKDEKIKDVWTCDGCNKKHESVKTTKLWRNPHVLIVSLKRFTHDLQKNSKRIEIPDILNLERYSLTNNTNTYELKAVAHHFGSFDSGHYHAICKCSDTWYDYDDLMVRKIEDPSHVHGYVFFYELSKS